MLSKIKEDIKVNEQHPILVLLANRGFHALLCYRISNELWKLRIPVLPLILTRLIQVVYSIDIHWKAKIEGGIKIVHGVGTVIGEGAVIKSGCTIFHGVTLGKLSSGKENDGFPTVGENVLLGAGCKILGNITIGKNAKIGANAVVNKDVPKNSIAVGIPAKIKLMNQKESV